jgi:hypothetical protein
MPLPHQRRPSTSRPHARRIVRPQASRDLNQCLRQSLDRSHNLHHHHLLRQSSNTLEWHLLGIEVKAHTGSEHLDGAAAVGIEFRGRHRLDQSGRRYQPVRHGLPPYVGGLNIALGGTYTRYGSKIPSLNCWSKNADNKALPRSSNCEFVGVRSWANHQRRERVCPQSSQNVRSKKTNSEQLFGRSGKTNQRSIWRNGSTAASARRSFILMVNENHLRFASQSSLPKCSLDSAAAHRSAA